MTTASWNWHRAKAYSARLDRRGAPVGAGRSTPTRRTAHGGNNSHRGTEIKNFAALDGLDERVEAVDKTIFETRAKANAAAISREAMREVLGSQTIRELVLK